MSRIMSSASWLPLLAEHIRQHPQAQAVDLYKFIFQATLGPEHMAQDEAAAGRFLQEEWIGLSEIAGRSLWEALRTDHRLGRLNLATWKAMGGRWQEVLEAFIATARSSWDEKFDLVARWRALPTLLGSLLPKSLAKSMAVLTDQLEAEGYPAVHHSETYRRAYRPSYRVVSREQFFLRILERSQSL